VSAGRSLQLPPRVNIMLAFLVQLLWPRAPGGRVCGDPEARISQEFGVGADREGQHDAKCNSVAENIFRRRMTMNTSPLPRPEAPRARRLAGTLASQTADQPSRPRAGLTCLKTKTDGVVRSDISRSTRKISRVVPSVECRQHQGVFSNTSSASAAAHSPKPFPGCYLLASCPDSILSIAIEIMRQHNQFNCAGDADDAMHKKVMAANEMDENVRGWRTAWKGKTCQAITMLRTIYPDKNLVVIAISGGPECDVERAALFSGSISNSLGTEYRLKQIGDIADLKAYFERGAPIP